MTVLEKLIYDLDTDDYQDTTFLAQDLEAQSAWAVAALWEEIEIVARLNIDADGSHQGS